MHLTRFSSYTFIFFEIIFFILYFSPKANANHAMAVDLTYTCVNDSTYELQLSFYFDCGTTIIEEAPESPIIQVASGACGELFDATLSLIPEESDKEVSGLCQDIMQAGDTNCQNGTWPGVKEYVYTGTVVLPKACEDWVFSYILEEGARRSQDITNLEGLDIYQLYIEAKVNNTNGLCNNAPTFNNLPVSYYCNQFSVLGNSAIETDGDSIAYSLVQPLSSAGTPIPYVSGMGLSEENPFLASSFDFDTQTGTIEFLPDGEQRPVVAVLVEEYRNGEFVGSVMRDMQLLILDCDNKQVQATTLPDPNLNYTFCPNELINFDFEVSDGNSDDQISISINAEDFPNATFTTAIDNPITANFSWQPTAADAGNHILQVIITDNRCPISTYLYYNYNIQITSNTDAGPDRTYCQLGGPIIIDVTGGNTFNWSPITNLLELENDGSQVLIEPLGDVGSCVTYTVTNDCEVSDEVTVCVAESFNLQVAGDFSLCQGGAAQLQVLAPVDTDNYTYQWASPNDDFLTATNIPNPVSQPSETSTYQVTVTSNSTGCAITGETTVTVSPSTAQVTLTAFKENLCLGESTQFESSVELDVSLNCGVNGTVCEETPQTTTIGSAEDDDANISPYNASWKNNRLQILYLQEDLVSAGIGSGTITDISFNISRFLSGGNTSYDNFTIKMGCTSLSDLSDFLPSLQDVYSAAMYTPIEGWNKHALTNAFDWDGESNLLVEVCYSNSVDGLPDMVSYTNMSYNAVVRAFSSSGNGCSLSANSSTDSKRPDIQLSVCVPPPKNPPIISWEPTTGLSDPTAPNPVVTPTETTTYTVSYDDEGCVGTAEMTLFVAAVDGEIEAKPDTFICESTAVELFIADSLPPTATYLWSPTDGLSNPESPSPTADVNQTTTYSVTVTWNNGCGTVSMDEVTVEVGELETPSVTAGASICRGDSYQINAAGGVHYEWVPATGLSCADCPNPLASPSATTEYEVIISDSTFNCQSSLPVRIEVVDSSANVAVTADQLAVRSGETIQLQATGSFTDIIWSPTEGLSDPTSATPSVILEQSTTYTATVSNGGSSESCAATADITLSVTACDDMVLPTAFSPDGNSLNDEFQLMPNSFDQLVAFRIYNRWGQLVFMGAEDNFAWDGFWQDEAQPVGTYTYHVSAICDGELLQKNGTVILVR